jgi:peptidoglycan/LPS O-acetylase OafA/YrhL
MKYRREIDGLRAVAVVPVIFHHAGFSAFQGGFVGVDVFFVISGYLITSIILNDIEGGQFSIVRFYERRARRILPALFFAVLIFLPLAWQWMLPSQLLGFAKSAVAVSLFVSNIYFWRESGGYFAPAAEEELLLHTWSLAIEEQFYILFPILILLIWPFGRRLVFAIVLAVAVISLGLADWASRNEPNANFFLLPTRVWELLVGSLTAIFLRHGKVRQANLPAAFGLLLIAASVVLYDDITPFPSLYALAPVCGTALFILYGGERTISGRFLGNWIFVGLGLLSYSAYLLHQPLFALLRIRLAVDPGMGLMLSMAVLTFVLAYFSWRFIEQPFRGPRPLLRKRGQLFAASLSSLVALAVLGTIGISNNGFPMRLSPSALVLLDRRDDRNPYTSVCQLQSNPPINGHPVSECTDFLFEEQADVIFLGDSHSDAISYPAQVALGESGISSYAYAAGGCPPILGVRSLADPKSRACEEHNLALRDFARSVSAKTIVLTSRFPLYYFGTRFRNSAGGSEHGADDTAYDVIPVGGGVHLERGEGARQERLLAQFVRGIEIVASEFNVILVYPIPEMGWNVPEAMVHCDMFGIEPCDLSVPYSDYLRRNTNIRNAFDTIDSPGLSRVDPVVIFCDSNGLRFCAAEKNGEALYFDGDHLANSTGAELLTPEIVASVQASLAPNFVQDQQNELLLGPAGLSK